MEKIYNLLLVDDENDLREIIADILSELPLKISHASNGKEATHILEARNQDLIISDIKMPIMNGLELLHWCKRENKQSKIILTTGFSDLLEAAEAVELGAYDFISKPFDDLALVQKVMIALDLKKRKQSQDNKYCQLDLNFFVSGNQIPCSIFIRLRENHYVKLANKGEKIPKSILDKFKSKKIKHLHILKEEYGEYLGLNLRLLKTLAGESKTPKQKVASFIASFNELISQDSLLEGMSNDRANDVITYSNNVLSVLADKNVYFDLLSVLGEHNNKLLAHSSSTAVVCYLIAKELGWKLEPNLFKAYLAGFLHDVGLSFMPSKVLETKSILRTDEEERLYRTHPAKGKELLSKAAKVIPEEVIQACYQHHEDGYSTGYPLKLSRAKASKLSRIVSVADMICEDMLTEKNLPIKDLYLKTVASLGQYEYKKYDPEIMLALEKIFKDG